MNKMLLAIEPEQFRKIVAEVLDEKLAKLVTQRPINKSINSPPPTELVKIDEISKMCKYAKSYVYELVRKDKIPVQRIGRSLRFNPREVQAWINAGRPSLIELGIKQLENID